MIRVPALALALLLVATPPAPAGPPATQPATRPEPSARDQVIAELARLPQSPSTPVSGLLRIRIDDGFLDITPTRTGDGQVAVTVTDWPGYVFLGLAAGTDRLSLIHHAFAGTPETQTITQIESGVGVMNLSRASESPTRVHSVQLVQHRTGNDNVPPVQLLIADDPGETGDATPARSSFTAATFADLCRQHPEAVREHLLPVFRDLKAEALLQTDDAAMAWQVLGELVPPDPAMAARVDGLLRRADADDPADRAKAADELAKLGPAGAAELRRRDLAALPPEPRSAVADAIRRNEPLRREQATRLAHDVRFLLDTLRQDDARLTTAAAKRLAIVTGRPIDLPAGLAGAERDRRIEAYAAAVMPAPQPTPVVPDMP